MNGSTLHILNGDGTWNSFVDSGLSGSALVWHEALCQGPALFNPSLDQFMSVRVPYLTKEYDADPEPYIIKFKNEWAKWEDLGLYSELVLWFEYDLFCQANLLFLCHLLFHRSPQPLKITLVSPSDHAEVSNFRGMGQLSPQQLAGLFPDRIQLDKTDLEFADRVWKAWTSQDLEKVYTISQDSPPNWPHLKYAIKAMLEELPSIQNGFSETERLILNFLTEGPKSPGDLFRHFLTQRDILGYGDVQFFKVLEGLIPDFIIQEEGKYKLQDGEAEVYKEFKDGSYRKFAGVNSRNAPDHYWIGPVHFTTFDNPLCWDQVTQKIVYST